MISVSAHFDTTGSAESTEGSPLILPFTKTKIQKKKLYQMPIQVSHQPNIDLANEMKKFEQSTESSQLYLQKEVLKSTVQKNKKMRKNWLKIK